MSGMATDKRGRAPRSPAPHAAGGVPAEQPALAQVIPHPRALARMKSAGQLMVPPGSMSRTRATGSQVPVPRSPRGSRPVAPAQVPRPARHPDPAVRRQAPGACAAAAPGTRQREPQRPRTARASTPGTRDGEPQRSRTGATPEFPARRAAPRTPRPPARRAAPRTPRPPARRVRLTRRGRLVVTGFMLAGMMMVAALAWLALAGPAQAAGSGARPGSVYKNLTTVVVRPGQTLWSIAVRAEPAADPRAVVREIADLNALSSTSVEPGQQLLVPRNR
jgi:hypothetical protein